MPELPEVETTRRGIVPHVKHQRIKRIVVRNPHLRWPIPADLHASLKGTQILDVRRRAKYLLLLTENGTLLIHLGMSGKLCCIDSSISPNKHDHVDILLGNNTGLRYTDPRRFGCLLWLPEDPFEHPLLKHLGPEPLSDDFNGDYLYQCLHHRKAPIKNLIMDAKIVVGVGNIYAAEALFRAGIHPNRAAHRLSLNRYQLLALSIQNVLAEAIRAGGTTLKDFTSANGKPGYFKQALSVYGRGGEPCLVRGRLLKDIRIGQRSTVYCSHCQT